MRMALDSCTFSRFLAANRGKRSDLHTLLFRLVMYVPEQPYLPPRVWAEFKAIADEGKRDEHWRFAASFFLDWPDTLDEAALRRRTDELLAHHPEPGDCRLVAECEAMQMDVLVSVDRSFIERLAPVAQTSLLSPGDAWRRLDISPNTPPVQEPAPKHPLAGMTYWRV